MYVGDYLDKGQSLVSSNGIYELRMRLDGYLSFHKNGFATWGVASNQGNRFIMENGRAVLYDINRNKIWYTTPWFGNANKIIIQNDGKLVTYDQYKRLIWSSL